MNEQVPFDYQTLQEKYGIIRDVQPECPGVYYVACRAKTWENTGTELYAVLSDSPAISDKAKSFGVPLTEDAHTLIYLDDFYGGWNIITYEIHKYADACGNPRNLDYHLNTEIAFGMEVIPEYFGAFPIPTDTPWGKTLEHRTLMNGLFRLRTETEGWVLAVCYPLCEDLGETTREMAELLPYDRENGIDETCGYRFFRNCYTCLAMFELLLAESKLQDQGINKGAIHNLILRDFPDYVEEYYSYQLRYGPKGIQYWITPSPEAGTDIFSDTDHASLNPEDSQI